MTQLGQVNDGRTKSFTPRQKEFVDDLVDRLAVAACANINAVAPLLQNLDTRPRQTYSTKQPDVFFPYVAQAILEDLIVELQTRV